MKLEVITHLISVSRKPISSRCVPHIFPVYNGLLQWVVVIVEEFENIKISCDIFINFLLRVLLIFLRARHEFQCGGL